MKSTYWLIGLKKDLKHFLYIFVIAGLFACSGSSDDNFNEYETTGEETLPPPKTKAEKIIEASIEIYGGSKFDKAQIAYDFLDRHYVITQTDGFYTYERILKGQKGNVHDVLSNNGFYRESEEIKVEVKEEEAKTHTQDIHTIVHYVLLPYQLTHPKIKKTYLGESTIKGQNYHKILADFAKIEDARKYVCWFHKTKNTLDYLAYSIDDETGFMEAVNPQKIEGFRFQNYFLYETKTGNDIQGFDIMYNEGKLEKVKDIVIENIHAQSL